MKLLNINNMQLSDRKDLILHLLYSRLHLVPYCTDGQCSNCYFNFSVHVIPYKAV